MVRKTLGIGRIMNVFVNHKFKKKSQGKQKIELNGEKNTTSQALDGILGLKGLYLKFGRNLQFYMLI